MAYFARKLSYGAHDGEASASYMALLELAKKKGGKPVGFVLYRRIMQYFEPKENRNEMIRLKAETAGEAIKRFWPSEDTGEEFPGHKSNCWEKTTLWLDCVAVGGGYELFHPGTWVRVGTPSLWSKRRKKKPLQFGNLAHILLVHEAQLRGLENEKSDLEFGLESGSSDFEEYDDDNDCNYIPERNQVAYDLFREKIQEKISEVETEISSLTVAVKSTRAEMRYKVRRMFPKPIGRIPRRTLRKQNELRGHRYPAMI
jgi:hypothetical protein